MVTQGCQKGSATSDIAGYDLLIKKNGVVTPRVLSPVKKDQPFLKLARYYYRALQNQNCLLTRHIHTSPTSVSRGGISRAQNKYLSCTSKVV